MNVSAPVLGSAGGGAGVCAKAAPVVRAERHGTGKRQPGAAFEHTNTGFSHHRSPRRNGNVAQRPDWARCESRRGGRRSSQTCGLSEPRKPTRASSTYPWAPVGRKSERRRRHAALVDVRFLAVLRDVEAGGLVGGVGAQRHDQADQLQQHEAHDAAVDDRRADRDGLDPDLAGIAEQQAVGDAVEALLREDAGQQRADRAADAVRRDDVERVVQAASWRDRSARSSSGPRRWRRGQSRSSGRRSRRRA